jgi:hypothetical protein
LLGQPARNDRLSGREQIEHSIVGDPVIDARPTSPSLHETDAAEGRKVLRRPTRVEAEIGLKRPHRPLSLSEKLQDPYAGRVSEHSEEIGFQLMDRANDGRHCISIKL